jgi:hypothetical protein
MPYKTATEFMADLDIIISASAMVARRRVGGGQSPGDKSPVLLVFIWPLLTWHKKCGLFNKPSTRMLLAQVGGG